MSTHVQLVRHGQVSSDWRNRIYGCLDVPLSSHGESEARRAAAFLADAPLAAVVSTGLSRSAFGAGCIAEQHALVVQIEPDLREIERGEWAKLSFDELEATFPGALAHWNESPWDRRPKGGESLGELSDRVVRALDRLAKQHDGKSIAIVAHRHVLRCALAAAIGRTESLEQIIPTGMVVSLDWPAAGKPTLISTEVFDSTDN
jgi:probable phosphoglycerate mutase